MKIKSITEVITNSSDEVFILKTTVDPEDIEERLEELLTKEQREKCSGMGGIIQAINNKSLDTIEGYQWLPDGYVAVDIDNAYLDYLVPWLKENYDVLSEIEVSGFRLEWIRENLEKALKDLEEATEQEDIDNYYQEWIYWLELEEQESYEGF